MRRLPLILLLVSVTGCKGARAAGPALPPDASHGVPLLVTPPPPDTAPPLAELVEPRTWLKGSTHVHAAPSGDSTEPIPSVMRWYQDHGYDFIALTDHNRVSEVDGATPGKIAVHTDGLIVLAGVELTNNPDPCDPPPPAPDGKCRIHVSVLGPTARPKGRIQWAAHQDPRRVAKYQAAIDKAREYGGIVQINHPQWHWGMTGELLAELGRRGIPLVEIANAQFATWNAGTETYPSMEALWDQALTAGVDLWGVASDDAHDYDRDGVYAADKDKSGFYPAGGGWVMVHAARTPASILGALRDGRFYASNGVTLERVEVIDGALVVEVAADHRIEFIGDGEVIAEHRGTSASQPLDAASYVRAVITAADGTRAWTQPFRKAAAPAAN